MSAIHADMEVKLGEYDPRASDWRTSALAHQSIEYEGQTFLIAGFKLYHEVQEPYWLFHLNLKK